MYVTRTIHGIYLHDSVNVYVNVSGLCGRKEFKRHLNLCFLQKINEKPQVIADYEAGKAIPNNQVMGKIERAIGKTQLYVRIGFLSRRWITF